MTGTPTYMPPKRREVEMVDTPSWAINFYQMATAILIPVSFRVNAEVFFWQVQLQPRVLWHILRYRVR